METIEIHMEPREADGKQKAKRLRREGKLPGIFYGPKAQSISLQFDMKEFATRVGGLEGSHLIRIKSASPLLADKVALLKEMQFHPVTGGVIHADFYEVDLTEKIQVKVPLHFVGKAAGVVRGGILQPVVREIEAECLPMDIPEFINVEVSSLDIGDALHVTDLVIPAGVVPIYETTFTVVTVVPPTVEEAPAAPAPVAAEVAEGAEAAPAEKEEKEEEPEEEEKKKA
ncbi:MAG: 50S ribosomal protein L25 [Deltaproteobacteria bacterium]|nr:50S ribosomal protein L25 [Deltaproteobacteria bacterium]